MVGVLRISDERVARLVASFELLCRIIRERMERQLYNAREWCDVINTFFHRLSGIPDEHGRVIYD